jgi:hypothetical protein
MSRRTTIRLVVFAVVLLVAVAGWLWFGPSGTGEFRHSPDGRYTAHASNLSAGTLTGGRDWYIEVRVVEQASGREVWRVVHRHPAGADVPDYGSRAGRFITWAADSSAVTVPDAGGRELVLAVP